MTMKKRLGIFHILVLMGVLILSGFSHKFYVSISQIEVNDDNKTLEISMRLFSHDLEEAIQKEKDEKLLLGSKKENPEAEKLIGLYVKKHFKIIQADKKLDYKVLGFELENDIIWIYVEAGVSQDISEISVFNDIISDLFEDQKNIINLKNKGKTQSQICTKDKPLHSFNL